ncbi:MAG TPA: sigma factor-like helix-turn-helix DNA-binding protein [Gemmatimonadaceae bacterium]|nr:sigma factor-like helix-turn-helix DNA-binding protein [Gemmatimonadaceae bacterium]
MPSESILLSAFLQDGDEVALATLVARLTPRLYRVARALTAWRQLGARTIVEQAWRAVLASPETVARGEGALAARLLLEVTRRSLAVGDSPRDDADADTDPARQAAMRAVALLPTQERAVYVLHDVAGVSVDDIGRVLARPSARVRVELWHARLAITTLLGATDASPASGGDDPTAPVPADLWEEPTPPELLARIAEAALHRRSLLASRPGSTVWRWS